MGYRNMPDCWLHHDQRVVGQHPLPPGVAARAEAWRQAHQGEIIGRENPRIKATHTVTFEAYDRSGDLPMCREHAEAANGHKIETFEQQRQGDAKRLAQMRNSLA